MTRIYSVERLKGTIYNSADCKSCFNLLLKCLTAEIRLEMGGGKKDHAYNREDRHKQNELQCEHQVLQFMVRSTQLP